MATIWSRLCLLLALPVYTYSWQRASPTAAGSPLLLRDAVNARDFGAKGDCAHPGPYGQDSGCLDCVSCDTDDAPALQRAIDAAQLSGRALYIPAGVYLVNTTLVIRCSGARDMIEDNSPNPMCDGVVNATHRFRPLRMMGEGMEQTVVLAGQPMRSVLELEALPLPPGGADEGGMTHNITGMHSVENIHFDAHYLANNSVMSFGVIRTRFKGVAATSALQYGFSLHNGFILQIEDCKMAHNWLAGVFVSENDNAIEITNCEPSGNYGHGIVAVGGAQISIHRNTIEGNGGAGIFASGVEALDITANYFEANCAPGVWAGGNPINRHGFVLTPVVAGVAGIGNITLNADIVLNGEGVEVYGAGDPNRGVRISSGYHSTSPNGSAILAIAVDGLTVDGCDNGDHMQPNPTSPLIRTTLFGPIGSQYPRLWNVSDVSCRGNSAFLDGYVRALVPGTQLVEEQLAAFVDCHHK